MEGKAKEFLIRLLETPGVSGYEKPVQDVVRAYAQEFADRVTTDLHGNVILARNPEGALRIMLAGHCDQIGLVVSQIDESGMLYTQTVGGWDPQQLVGQRVIVWTSHGGVLGVIARKPIHLLEEKERNEVVKLKDLWIDIGAANQDDAAALVHVGDSATLHLGFQPMRGNLANAPAMDDRTGLWVVVEALRRAAKRSPVNAVYAVSTVQEEIGLRGVITSAFGIDPHVGIAVDVTHATDCPTIDKRQLGAIALGKGPVLVRGPNINPRLHEKLVALCTERQWPFQRAALGRVASNDAASLQICRAGVATAVVGIPNRYMHSAVETVSLDDLDQAAQLLAEFCCSAHTPEEFIP
jgi:endoglucanase